MTYPSHSVKRLRERKGIALENQLSNCSSHAKSKLPSNNKWWSLYTKYSIHEIIWWKIFEWWAWLVVARVASSRPLHGGYVSVGQLKIALPVVYKHDWTRKHVKRKQTYERKTYETCILSVQFRRENEKFLGWESLSGDVHHYITFAARPNLDVQVVAKDCEVVTLGAEGVLPSG